MPEELDTDRCTLVIHYPKGHPQAGYIKQVVQCLRRDVKHQAQHHKGLAILDVSETHPGAHPDHHMVDFDIEMLVDRVAPLDEVRDARVKHLEQSARVAIGDGFKSSATGKARKYRSDHQHQTDFLHAVHVGGELETHDGDPVDHTAAQGKQVLADFVKHKGQVLARLAKLKARIEAAQTADDIHAIDWHEEKP